MVYGDGDGRIFLALTRSLSVIGHELSHGVVQYSGGLVYQDQAGALNESFADVFGVLTVQHQAKQEAADASWLVGDGILGPKIEGEALRSLKAPGTAYRDRLLGEDPQPFHMSDYVNTSSDNGGVHINSGIPNHAFYLLARFLGGFAWEKAGHIWYDTLQGIDNPHATFTQWADQTVEAARKRFGAGSLEELFTRRAWKLVGIAL
jgi:Zn-dependent metalloprotease